MAPAPDAPRINREGSAAICYQCDEVITHGQEPVFASRDKQYVVLHERCSKQRPRPSIEQTMREARERYPRQYPRLS